MVANTFYFKTCYISCASNSTPHVVDWNDSGLICYGACNVIVLYKPESDREGGSIIATLSGHKGRVNCVKWLKNNNYYSDRTEFVSGASDGTAIIWTALKDNVYLPTSVITGHDNSVTIVDAVYKKVNEEIQLVLVTASVDSTVKIWIRTNEEIVCNQVLTPPSNGLCLSIALTTYGKTNQNLLIACGFDDSRVTLYSQCNAKSEVTRQTYLVGHEDWIRALDFTINDDNEIMLASASQDSTVRLWRFMSLLSLNSNSEVLKQEINDLEIGSDKMAVVLEGVLSGHEGWIYGVHWHPPIVSVNGRRSQPMQLLTSSLDKTLAVWAPEEQSGVWLEVARMGEIGGNGIGFYGARYGPYGKSLLVHGFTGGIHIWRKINQDLWKPGVSITGHFNGVVDLAWEAVYGRYLLSVSLDQTTRLHAPWLQNKATWHEMARPQVHGFDMSCIAALPNYSFVSGAEEKVIRAFAAPKNFLENFDRLCCLKTQELNEQGLIKHALGAAVPALGLSNRAVYNVQNQQQSEEDKLSREQYTEAYFVPQILKAPPTDDNLGQNTLWPEVMKLYGHGYEVFTLAASHDGSKVASACKATNSEHASIIIWETSKWQKVQTLISHQLTVTQLAFSPDDLYLLAVSRDRCWTLFEKNSTDYTLLVKCDKKSALHTRIIWTCAWSHDSLYFGTGSRDGKVVVWEAVTQKPSVVLDLTGSSVTSLAFAPDFITKGEYLTAIGLETGEISLYSCSPNQENGWKLCFKIDGNFGHTLAVKRLAFRPVVGRAGELEIEDKRSVVQLASCGLDHIVKIYDIIIENDLR